MIYVKSDQPFVEWCYCKSIYFYAYIAETGFCTITKWVQGVPTHGCKLFPVESIGETIENFYKQVYLKNVS